MMRKHVGWGKETELEDVWEKIAEKSKERKRINKEEKRGK